MGNGKWTDTYFSKRLRTERVQRHWSQAEMAERLTDRLADKIHWTTIAKIEAGSRAVRITEAVGIADLFGVSLDALLGRSVTKNDAQYAARALHDAVKQTQWQLESIETTARDRLAEWAAIPAPKGFALGFPDAVEVACDKLADARTAFDDALNQPEAKPFQRLARKMLVAEWQKEERAR